MPFPKPAMVQVPSPNFGFPRGTTGRAGNNVIAIVEHIMQGTLPGTDSWFGNPTSQVSAHFGVGKNGEIHQYVDLNNAAWGNGVVNTPSWPLLIPNTNPNYYTVSIEHEGQSGDQFSEAQYQASLSLHRWLIETLNLQINENTLIGHNKIDSVNKVNCPGSGFPWQRLFADLKGGDIVKLNYLVLYYGDADLTVAANLAQYFQCPIIQASYAKEDLLAYAVTKYQVGGSSAPEGVTLLAGADRFDTMKAVLKLMGKI